MGKSKHPEEPGHFIVAYVEAATPVFREAFTANRCLNATRVCLDVMRRFNIRAEPISVHCMVMNKAFVMRLNGCRQKPTKEEIATWPEDAWCVGIDTDNPLVPGNWPGHLVAVVQKDWLVDSALVQLSRPQKSINLPDIFVGRIDRQFLKGKRPVNYYSDREGILTYKARPEDKSYLETSGFNPSPWNREVTEAVVERMMLRP